MAHTTLGEAQIKDLCKQAFEEVLQERKDLLYDLLAEIIEDFGLLNAIKKGEDSEKVERDEVFQVLEGTS